MKKNRLIAFVLFALMCVTILAPSLAWANDFSTTYNLSISGEFIKGIPAEVSVEQFISSMKEETTVTFNGDAQEYIVTGCTISMKQSGSFYAVVLGDVDGSGKVDTTDYLKIKQYCLGFLSLEGAFYQAADVDGSGDIDSTDYLRIKGHFIGHFNLFAEAYLPEEPSEEESSSTRFENISEVVKNAGFTEPTVGRYENISGPVSIGADPYVTHHNGRYYYSFNAWGTIFVSSFDSLDKMTTDGASHIVPSDLPENAKYDIWSPEIHFMDGYWYVYYSASNGVNENHRMFVLKSKTSDALGEYEFAGQVTDSTNKWAANGTVFEYKNEMYFAWSGWEGDVNYAQNIYIAKMSSPTTISSERICISVPERTWEIQGGSPLVNDGPCAISSNDYLTILYSASGSWCDDYCIGQLLFLGGDVLDPKSWSKHDEPILQKNPVRFYAPGNCCVTTDEKGVMWMLFHANQEAGTGWDGRSIWKYPIRVNEDGIVEVVFGDMAEVVEDANFPDPLVDGFVKVTNPVCGGADPSFEYYNGKYYWTAGFLGTIIISPFDSLHSVSTSGAVPVDYRIFPNNDDIWAPELHYIDGTWYMYYTAGKDDAHRMYVLRGKTDDPLGEYEFVGQVTDPTNKWAIDGSIFEYKGELYFIWSGWEGDVNYAQNIYIARMSSPTTISSERVCLSVPEKIWEVQGGSPLVNEGPCAITSGDYLTILYSASGSWCDDYCIGQLLFRGGDVLDPNNWEKQPEPILKKDPAWFYGPGHCCITTDENGIMWIVFHANDVSGTGWNGRSIRMYPIRINEKGVVEVILYR